ATSSPSLLKRITTSRIAVSVANAYRTIVAEVTKPITVIATSLGLGGLAKATSTTKRATVTSNGVFNRLASFRRNILGVGTNQARNTKQDQSSKRGAGASSASLLAERLVKLVEQTITAINASAANVRKALTTSRNASSVGVGNDIKQLRRSWNVVASSNQLITKTANLGRRAVSGSAALIQFLKVFIREFLATGGSTGLIAKAVSSFERAVASAQAFNTKRGDRKVTAQATNTASNTKNPNLVRRGVAASQSAVNALRVFLRTVTANATSMASNIKHAFVNRLGVGTSVG